MSKNWKDNLPKWIIKKELKIRLKRKKKICKNCSYFLISNFSYNWGLRCCLLYPFLYRSLQIPFYINTCEKFKSKYSKTLLEI